MNKFVTLLTTRKLFDCRSIATRISIDGKDVPKKPNIDNRITLIGTDNSVSITDLKNAQNLSTRRELKLVKIQDVDSKTRRPIYKMMTNVQFHEEELSRRLEKQSASGNKSDKGQKLITLSSRIAEHDLLTSVKKIGKLLEKSYEVRIIISGESNEQTKMDKITTIMERNLKSVGKIVQMRNKGTHLRFNIVPIRNTSSNEVKNESDLNHNNDKNDDKGPL